MSALSGAGRHRSITLEEFVEHGMLWVVNASVFHPRGLALEFDDRGPGKFTVLVSNPIEPIIYHEDMQNLLRKRMEAFERFVEEMRG